MHDTFQNSHINILPDLELFYSFTTPSCTQFFVHYAEHTRMALIYCWNVSEGEMNTKTLQRKSVSADAGGRAI
jgi:hypothetical protein